jgi:hypothetical protein
MHERETEKKEGNKKKKKKIQFKINNQLSQKERKEIF